MSRRRPAGAVSHAAGPASPPGSGSQATPRMERPTSTLPGSQATPRMERLTSTLPGRPLAASAAARTVAVLPRVSARPANMGGLPGPPAGTGKNPVRGGGSQGPCAHARASARPANMGGLPGPPSRHGDKPGARRRFAGRPCAHVGGASCGCAVARRRASLSIRFGESGHPPRGVGDINPAGAPGHPRGVADCSPDGALRRAAP